MLGTEEPIHGPHWGLDWDNAEVVVRVPCHETGQVTSKEFTLHIKQFADLIAGQVRVEGNALIVPQLHTVGPVPLMGSSPTVEALMDASGGAPVPLDDPLAANDDA